MIRRSFRTARCLAALAFWMAAGQPFEADAGIAETAWLKAGNNGTTGDGFGISVAISGDTMVVGAPNEDGGGKGSNSPSDETAGNAGAAYVFVRQNGTWMQQAYLKPFNPGQADFFGLSVAISGDTIVIGAPQEDGSGAGVNPPPDTLAWHAGAAYVFVRQDGVWSQQAYLKASNPGDTDSFGLSVAVSEDIVVVGAREEDTGGPNAGAAYVFHRENGTWRQEVMLKAANAGADDMFGESVAVSGETIVVGSLQENGSGTGVNPVSNENARYAGAAYVFVRNDGVWTQQAYLKASNTEAYDGFGSSVSISGDTAVVGAMYEDGAGTGVNPGAGNGASESGAAYVFVRTGSTWAHEAYLKASNTGAGDFFGFRVAVSGDTIVAGADNEDGGGRGVNAASDDAQPVAGAAYVFRRTAGVWAGPVYLKASNTENQDYFSSGLAISGDTVVVGASGENGGGRGIDPPFNESTGDAGAAYVYTLAGGVWNSPVYIKASNTEIGDGTGDWFGWALAVSGDIAVVGARYEKGSGTGINPVGDERSPGSGAVHVFVRSNGVWKYDALLKASNTSGADYFGGAVAVSGETIVVGAPLEDGSGLGINPPDDGNAADSGAAYIFVRQGGVWTQQAYLKASNRTYEFGGAVSISGDTVVIGARSDNGSGAGVNPPADPGMTAAGAAYVFVRNGSVWSQQAYLKASNPGPLDYFGTTVAISGDTLVVGATGEDTAGTGVNPDSNEGASSSGAAYVFVRNAGGWSQQAWLKAANAGAEDFFGGAAAISEDTIVIGAVSEDSSGTGVNAPSDDNAGYSGAAYVFGRRNGLWTQQAFLKASNTSASDFFGDDVAVSGDLIVVGASGEDSSDPGINPVNSSGVSSSGAAYVFMRSGDTWTQKAWMKASNPGEQDYFGTTVAVSGDLVAVGAYSEDSSGAGVNPSRNETSRDSGAVYLFGGFHPREWEPFRDAVHQAGLSGSEDTPLAEPYDDGVPNLLKYAFNLNLTGPDRRELTPGTGTGGLPAVSVEDGPVVRVEFLRRSGGGLIYTPLLSSDAASGSWHPLTTEPVITALDAVWERVVYEEPLSNSAGRNFVVVQVSFAP